jgi:quinol-cytochrome oxidoreductase complex cytochrome b subunit
MGKPLTHKAIKNFFLHLHPLKIDPRAIRFNRTFGLGGIAALLIVVLFFTGLLLKFIYVPSASGAYDSIVFLQQEIIFGRFLRNLHHWSAMLLVVVVFLHLVRVFYSQSIFYGRRKNWLYGLLLLFLVVSANFTGYLLPWDQLSYWAVTIMTNMFSYIPVIGEPLAGLIRDGETVSENTLLRFYHFHTGLLPILLIFFMAIHFWLVRKVGGVALPPAENVKKVNTHPHLVYKEVFVAVILLLALFLFSMFVDAPLLEKAKPSVNPNPSKAPWYFMGFQELLIHTHATFGAFIIPLLTTVFFIAMPFFRYKELNPGTWFHSENGKRITIISAAFSILFTFLFSIVNDFLFDFSNRLAGWPSIISTGLLPFILYLIPMAGFLLYLKRKREACRIEMVIAAVTILLAAYITMMLTGVFLRGEGMQLIF